MNYWEEYVFFSSDMSYEKLPLRYTYENTKKTFEFRYKEIDAINFEVCY